MFPPPLAAFAFHTDPAGSDSSLAARFSAATAERPLLLFGADRTDLITGLAGLVEALIVVDPSRASLRTARAACATEGVAERVTFLAADPRDLDVPGGCRGALIPSLVWRAVATSVERQELLACLSRALEPGGLVCLDLERVPDEFDDDGVVTRPGADLLQIDVELPDSDGLRLPLLLSSQSIADAQSEIVEAGFELLSSCDAASGEPLDEDSPRAWLVARAPSGTRSST